MEQIATTADGGQVVMQAVHQAGVSPQQVQMVQMNPGQVIQGANGQQIMVHTVPHGGQIQVATGPGAGAQGLQQIQVVPVSSLQTAQGQVLLQQPQQAQLVQTVDGQTFIYQPVAIENAATIQQAQPTVININGNLVQLAGAPQTATAAATVGQPATVTAASGTQAVVPQTITTATPSQLTMPNGNIVMVRNASDMVPGTSGAQFQRVPIPGSEFLEEEPLYVNAKQYRRILKRRQARAKLESAGKIPKERPKYLHESRHRHAMNRIRGEGGRFHSGSVKKRREEMERQQQQHQQPQQQHQHHQHPHQPQQRINVQYNNVDLTQQIIIENVLSDSIKPDPLSIEGN